MPAEKIIEAHGSFATQHCIQCKAGYPDDEMKEKIEKQELPKCKKCKGYVKPDIVFFGEGVSICFSYQASIRLLLCQWQLPPAFFSRIEHLRDADLLIVMGTSLSVHPFASLTENVDESCPRLLLNLDLVGGWGSRSNDVSCIMPCDDAVRQICQLLGWEEELDALWAETAHSVASLSKEDAKEEEAAPTKVPVVLDEEERKAEKQAKADLLEDFVEKLAEKIADVGLDEKEDGLPKAKETESEKNEEVKEGSDVVKTAAERHC